MTKKGNTKKALLMSALSLLLCVSMLVGTTFAWFTDEVVSGQNIIAAGNLDVELTHVNNTNKDKGGETVSGATDLFEDVTLWEPGAVAYENFMVSNVGTLDLKYLLALNFTNENAVVTDGKAYTLSQALKVAVVEDGVDTSKSREEIVAGIEADKWQSLATFSLPGKLLDGETDTYGIVIYWKPSDNDNNWNVNNGKITSDGSKELHITLGVKLEATQLVSESDSFGPDYDKDAHWTGLVNTDWYNNTDTEFVIDTAEELAGLAQIVNSSTDTFKGKTVKLGADIDLNDVSWTPIGSSADGWNSKFNGSFYGNGYTISNLYVVGTTGLGLFGYVGSTAHIEGVNIVNAYVSGNDYVGAVLGSGYLAVNCLKNCTVDNATIIATPYMTDKGVYDGGAKAGVIAGYAINGHVIGNKATNSTVIAYRDLGGIVGMLSGEDHAVNASGNTAENITLTYVGVMGNYDGGKVNGNMNAIVGRISNATVAEDNVFNNITENKDGAVVITTAEELYTFAASVNGGMTYKGKTVLLGANIDLQNAAWTPIGNSTTSFQGIFDGQNHTISNLNVSMAGKSNVGLFGMTTNGTIKNLVVENAIVTGRLNVGVVAGTPYTSKYENITVKGHVEVNGMSYVGGVGGKNAYANWSNITVNVDDTSYVKADSVENGTAYRTYVGGVIGFMGEGGHTVSNVTSNIDVIGSTCDVGGIVGIAHYGNSFINCVSSGDVTINNAGEAADAEEMGGIAGVWNNGGADVTFAGCKYTGKLSANITEGVDLSDNTIHGAAYSATGTGKVVVADAAASSEEELVEALKKGGTVLVLKDIELTKRANVPENVKVTLDLNGKKLSSASDILIYSEGDLTIIGNGKIESEHSSYAIRVQSGSMVIESANISVNGAFGAISIFNGAEVTINGGNYYAGGINGKTSHTVYVKDSTLIVNDGTFDSGYSSEGIATITANNSTAILNGGIFYASELGKSFYMTNTTINGGSYQFNPTTLPANKNIVVNGTVTENSSTGLFDVTVTDADLSELFANAKDGDTIYLPSGEFVVPDSAKKLTIVGNGSTKIKNVDDGSYEHCEYSLRGATVTFENVTIATDGHTYAGYAGLNATYNNCVIENSYTLYGNSEFNNCTFNVSGDSYNIWTWGAPTAEFNNCTFNTSGKAILLYGGTNTKLVVTNCTFNDDNAYDNVNNKAAIEVGSDWTTDTKEIIATNVTVNGFDVTNKGTSTGSTLWGNKNSLSTDRLNVVIDGVDVY